MDTNASKELMRAMENLGESLKRIRASQNLTLSEIAAATQLSVGYLSKVERNINNPTILNLQKICTALHTSINDVFGQPTQDIHYRKKDRITIVEYSDVMYESASAPDNPLRASIMTIQPGAVVKTYAHMFDEIGFILSGSVEICVREQTYALATGDTIFVPQGSQHTVWNRTKDVCVSYWVKGTNTAIDSDD